LGFFQIEGQPGSDVRAAHFRHTGQAVSKLVLLFQRVPGAFAARAVERAEDYPFAYVELYISRDGKFEGMLVPVAQVGDADGDAAIGDFGAYPARLVGSRRP
jgi:hypothetical protein